MDPQKVLQGVQDAMTARTVFGEPIRTEGVTVLPVATVSGGGGGGGKGDEGGVGYGLRACPAGIYVITKDDAVWRPAVNVNWIIAGGQLVLIAALLGLRPLLSRWLMHRPGAEVQHAA